MVETLRDKRETAAGTGNGRCYRILGHGDAWRGRKLLDVLAERMEHARQEHPRFAEGSYQALGVIGAEYSELEKAVVKGEGRTREQDEALDVAATALRFWLGEHLEDR